MSTTSTSPQTPAERFALIMMGLLRCVGARVTRNLRSGGFPAAGMAPLPAAMAALLYARLELARALFAALAERVRLGTARTYPNRAAARRPDPADPSGPADAPAPFDPSAPATEMVAEEPSGGRERAPKPPRLPRGMGGVVGLLYWEAAYQAELLRQLLAEPEMVALIRSAPGFARILRPLCRMLGIVPADGLFPPPAPRSRAASPATRRSRRPVPAWRIGREFGTTAGAPEVTPHLRAASDLQKR